MFGKKIKQGSFWIRRKSHLPVVLIGGLIVVLLFLNEETSVRLNVKYQKEINELERKIQLSKDSALYYRSRREAIESGSADLEHVAREQFHMLKPSEDLFIIKD